MIGSRLSKRTVLLHPLVIFSFIWFAVAFLYALHLSSLLLYSSQEVMLVTSYIWIPFVAVVVLYSVFHRFTRWAYPSTPKPKTVNFDLLERRLVIGFRIWILVSIVEICISGGIPIVWLLQGNAKTYMDFGVPSLHGLVNALIASIAVCRFALYLITGKRKHLIVPVFLVIWSILAVTRQLMLASLIEYAVVFLSIKKIQPSTILRIVIAVMATILLFGFVGDLRQGSVDIRGVAQPTERYPEWLPSGVLWVYIYITTPINNLVYTLESVSPASNALFPNTLSNLVPTVLRAIVYGPEASSGGSELVTASFNVSTAYVNPYQDYGVFGMALYSMLTGFACQFFWYRINLRDFLIFAVLIQCLMFTVFSNLLFTPPELAQTVWLFILFMPKVRLGKSIDPLRVEKRAFA